MGFAWGAFSCPLAFHRRREYNKRKLLEGGEDGKTKPSRPGGAPHLPAPGLHCGGYGDHRPVHRDLRLIEVSALRVRGGQVVEEFSTLIRPPWRQVLRDGEWREGYVDDFIQGLTGITDEMLEARPCP